MLGFRHMLEHARETLELTRGRSRADLDDDRSLQLQVERLLEIVGEAAARIPSGERAERPDVPWPDIVGLRNRLVHEYDAVDYDVVWEIVTLDLPALVTRLEQIVRSEEAP
jgi:uncharacterized protein with HEPN domain